VDDDTWRLARIEFLACSIDKGVAGAIYFQPTDDEIIAMV